MDIAQLILADHERQRQGFALLDEARATAADDSLLTSLWAGLRHLLSVHADAEEALFYPQLLVVGREAEDETDDAIGDHNQIRDGIRRTDEQAVGSTSWWDAVADTRVANSDHMGEEERGALAEFRRHASLEERQALGPRFAAFEADHTGNVASTSPTRTPTPTSTSTRAERTASDRLPSPSASPGRAAGCRFRGAGSSFR